MKWLPKVCYLAAGLLWIFVVFKDWHYRPSGSQPEKTVILIGKLQLVVWAGILCVLYEICKVLRSKSS